MVSNRIALLIKCGLGLLCDVHNGHVITIYQLQTKNRHSHHLKLVLQSPEQLHSNIHCYELSTEHQSLNLCLLL